MTNYKSLTGDAREWINHLEREVYGEPTNHIFRNVIFSLRVNAEPDASVQNCLEITRETVQNPCVGDMEVQVGEPGIMAMCHRESYSRVISCDRSVH
jgi:hypothetical protein